MVSGHRNRHGQAVTCNQIPRGIYSNIFETRRVTRCDCAAMAIRAILGVLYDIRFDLRPPVLLLNRTQHLRAGEMSSKYRIMERGHDGTAQGVGDNNLDKTFTIWAHRGATIDAIRMDEKMISINLLIPWL